MHPTLALSIVLLSWCAVRNRTLGSRSLLAAAVALLGWEPATGGDRIGVVLLLIATGVAVSIVWDLASRLLFRRRALPAAVPATSAAPPGRVPPSPPPPAPATPAGEPFTELERADVFGDMLEANLGGLVDAYRSGDLRAQAAFAGEIADVARSMESMLRVVVYERHRVHGFGTPPPS